MILAYPVLLVAAAFVAVGRRHDAGGRGWTWLAAWTATGAVFTFSFLTGLSIGLLILPLAAFALLGAAWFSPHLAEAAGFVVGLGAILLVVAAIGHGDATPWLVAGLVAFAFGLGTYALLSRPSSS